MAEEEGGEREAEREEAEPPGPASASPLVLASQEVAALLSPEAVLSQHLGEVEAVADGLLARLDELTAMLGTVSADCASQQSGLEPALRSLTAGLARDFAYVDGVGVSAAVRAPSARAHTYGTGPAAGHARRGADDGGKAERCGG